MNILILLVLIPAYALGHYFVVNDPGPTEPFKALRSSVIFGLLALSGAVALSFVIDFMFFKEATDPFQIIVRDSELSLLTVSNVFLHAFGEEIVKFVPLAVYVYHKRYFNEITDGVIYFAIVGLTFGAVETLGYALFAEGIQTILLRFALALFLHAATTTLVGYVLAKHKMLHVSFAKVFGMLVLAGVLHTAYNLGVLLSDIQPSFVWLAVAVSFGLNAALFALFYRAARIDIRQGFANQVTDEVHSRQPWNDTAPSR